MEDESQSFQLSTSSGPATPSPSPFTSIIASRKRSLEWIEPVWTKYKRPKRSGIWAHGKEVQRADGDGHSYWKCDLCGTAYRMTGTSGPQVHLQKIHGLLKDSRSESPLSIIDQQRSASLRQEVVGPSRTPEQAAYGFKTALIRWLCGAHVAYHQVENQDFRNMILGISSLAYTQLPLPESSSTISSWVMLEFHRQKALLRTMLRSAISDFNLSFDLWTSDNNLSLIAVVAHFISAELKPQHVLLGMKEVLGSHSGENIGATVLEVIRDYQIQDRIGWIMLDNAYSNDTAVSYLVEELDLDRTAAEVRLRCMGHVLNLAAQDFLFGKNSEDFLRTVDEDEQWERRDEATDKWLTKGPVGILLAFITLLRRSPTRQREFRQISGGDPDEMKLGLMLISNNMTRWNSTHAMIARANKLMDSIELYFKRRLERKGEEKDMKMHKLTPISEDDKEFYILLESALEPFVKATARLQGHAKHGYCGALWECLPVYETLLTRLEKTSNELNVGLAVSADERAPAYNDPYQIGLACNTAWNKLVQYYRATDESSAYVAAIVLNPFYKWDYFDLHWKGNSKRNKMITNAKKAMKNLWEKYKASHPRDEVTLPTPTKIRLARDDSDDEIEAYTLLRKKQAARSASQTDEYNSYLATPALEGRPADLYEWWTSQRAPFPVLSRLALTVLSIPGMSAECERVFSQGKRLLADDRNRMTAPSIEADMCIANWNTRGLFA